MARKFVSPGVFTQEIDQSFVAAGIAQIGAVVIGATPSGPAFVPTKVGTWQEFQDRFGQIDPTADFTLTSTSVWNSKYTLPYAARNYLKNSSVLTVVRVLGSRDSQSNVSNGWAYNALAITDVSGAMLAELHVPTYGNVLLSNTGSADFGIRFFSGSTLLYSTTASFVLTNADYADKVFNDDPTQVATYGHYLYKIFKWTSGSGAPYASASLSGTNSASLDVDYTDSQTPWLISQPLGGQTYQLMRFWTRASGKSSIDDYRVTITNIKASSNTTVTRYGQFDVVISNFSDGKAVKTIPGCDLDPSSVNFVARRIGDTYFGWDGTNRKKIKYGTFPPPDQSMPIRVELSPYFMAAPPEALPWGFGGFPENVTSAGTGSLVDLPLVTNNLDTAGNVSADALWGIDFTQKNISDRLKKNLATSGVNTIATGSTFSLNYVYANGASTTSGQPYAYSVSSTGTGSWPAVPGTASVAGFSLPLYGGFDGFDITQFNQLDLADSAAATNIGVVSLKRAVDSVANPDEYDMNLVAIPGCVANKVTDYARAMCAARADAMLIMDITGSSVSDAISKLSARQIDDNYAATYYPDLVYYDADNTRYINVKPSVAILGAFAFSDRIGQVFFAPAGLNRGGINQFGITDVVDTLRYQDRNDLYDARINPIAAFTQEGINVYGQKTLQAKPSALDRINVRRLLIFAKKTIASVAKSLLFEPNNENTWDRFLRTVNAILEDIRKNQGIERFKVVMDRSVNTPDLIDRNVMTGKIFLQPTKAAEYIDLSFIISSSGVSFEE